MALSRHRHRHRDDGRHGDRASRRTSRSVSTRRRPTRTVFASSRAPTGEVAAAVMTSVSDDRRRLSSDLRADRIRGKALLASRIHQDASPSYRCVPDLRDLSASSGASRPEDDGGANDGSARGRLAQRSFKEACALQLGRFWACWSRAARNRRRSRRPAGHPGWRASNSPCPGCRSGSVVSAGSAAIAIAVAGVAVGLTAYWMPLGPRRTLFANLLFVAILVAIADVAVLVVSAVLPSDPGLVPTAQGSVSYRQRGLRASWRDRLARGAYASLDGCPIGCAPRRLRGRRERRTRASRRFHAALRRGFVPLDADDDSARVTWAGPRNDAEHRCRGGCDPGSRARRR